MDITERTTEYALKHSVYGFLNTVERDGCTFTYGLPAFRFSFGDAAEAHVRPPLYVVPILVETFSCPHERQMAYSIARGKNKGKWVALCVDCGAKSSGRPKSTEAIAHEALLRRPAVNAKRLVKGASDGR